METLGFVSHELKSPVASIMNYVYLLREQRLGPLTEAQRKAVRSIDGSSQRLVEMVRHYLNLSRIENRELQPARTRVAVRAEVLEPIVESLSGQAAERGMRLDLEVPEPVTLWADMNMTREIFENLIGNAVKYGRDGGRVRVSCSDDEGGMVRFSIWNEGAGIAPERMGQLFQKFSRMEGADHVRRQKGTGLGLFITKHIAEAHGGRAGAASEPGQWAEFTVTLPKAGAEGEAKPS
jgi:signal transduction histidine kinase